MTSAMQTLAYVRRWFVPFDRFCAGTGVDAALIAELIAVRAIPGPIYADLLGSTDLWWSALGDAAIPPGATPWFAPAAIWWGRRATLTLRDGKSVQEIAAVLRQHFATTFVAALADEPLSAAAFPIAFRGTAIDRDAARTCALQEWESWIGGGYGVCLQRFSGESCVRKEALASTLRRHLDGVPGARLARHYST